MLRSTRALFQAQRHVARSNIWKQHAATAPRPSLSATRLLSTATPLRSIESAAPVQNTTTSTPVTTDEVLKALSAFNADARTVVRKFQNLHQTGTQQELSPEAYVQLLKLVRSSDDIDIRGIVCKWFYLSHKKSPLKENIICDLDVWKEALKLGLAQNTVSHHADLSMMVAHFRKLFSKKAVEDAQIWSLLLRAYGVLKRPDEVAKCAELAQKQVNGKEDELMNSLILAYAGCHANEKVDQLLATLDGPSEQLLRSLSRSYAFSGDVLRTRQYCGSDEGLVFVAYKAAILKEYTKSITNFSMSESHYRLRWNNDLEALDKAFQKDFKQMFLDKPTSNISESNMILSYLYRAHIMNPADYPMARIEKFFREEMPARRVEPDESTYSIMLKAYSRSQEYQDVGKSNTRLDKALALLQEIQERELDMNMRTVFQDLFKACIPHETNYYPFDNFLYSIKPLKRRLHLDKRFFAIENAMLDTKIRYDKQTFMVALTCLGAAGQYKAMWNRWHLTKQSGLQRDSTMYRHIFALASLDKKQADYALSVTTEELVRELPQQKVDQTTYIAMLDCCVTAQNPVVAKQIIATIRDTIGNRNLKYYRPLLRTTTMIKGLESEAAELFEEVHKKDVPYDSVLWKAAMRRAVSEGGDNRGQKVQQLFTKYTMDRFEQTGKIPIPIRERAPVVPFPSGTYSNLDAHMIELYIASLVDSQDVSLALDTLKALKEQDTGKLQLSKKTIAGFVQLAKREKSDEDLSFLSNLCNK